MTMKLGLLALLEAKSGKGPDLELVLERGRAIAVAQEGIVTWYAFKVSETEFGIFDTFEREEGVATRTLAARSPRRSRRPVPSCWPRIRRSGWSTSSPSSSNAQAAPARA